MKIRSLILFLLITVIILTSAWGVFCGVSLGVNRFAPMEVLQLGADWKGETSIFLDVQNEEGQEITQEQLEQTMDVLIARLDILGYGFSSVVQLDSDQIEVQVPLNETTFHDVEQLAEKLQQTGRLYITDSANDDAVLIDRDSIERIELQEGTLGKYSIFLIMTEEGTALFEQVSKEVSEREKEEDKYVNIYLDDEELAELSIREIYTDGIFGFTSSYSEYEATLLQQIVNSGMLPVALDSSAGIMTSAVFGENAWQSMLLCYGISMFVVAVILIIIYRISGLINVLTMIAYQVLMVLFLALLGIQVTGSNFMALLIGFGFLLASMVYVNHTFFKQHLSGKNIRAAYKSGYTQAMSRISNGMVFLFLGFVVLISSGIAALENLAYGYGIALVMAYVCIILINRLLFALMVRMQDHKESIYFPLGKTGEGGRT